MHLTTRRVCGFLRGGGGDGGVGTTAAAAAKMSAEIVTNGESTFTVTLDGRHRILTTVTSSSAEVSQWISSIYSKYRFHLHHLIVGLDVEWRPNLGRGDPNPVALLQLCVGRRCLVFQLLHADSIPASLDRFLLDSRFSFVGVGIAKDALKLEEDHGLEVAKTVDLGRWAADVMFDDGLNHAGLKRLANSVVGIDMEKPKRVRLGRWDNYLLDLNQIKYAAVDAFLSFQIGRTLHYDHGDWMS